jgi:hypothetical protein
MSCSVTSLSYQARCEVVARVAPCYHDASYTQKGLLLDAVMAATGYTRKHAIGLLNQPPHGKSMIVRPRLPIEVVSSFPS